MSTIDYYNENAEEFTRTTVNVDMTALYEPFLKLLPAKAHILDAGCGPGRDSLYFLKNGYRVTAMDASYKFVHMAVQLIEQPVLLKRFQEVDFDSEFDGVWASASLLHVRRNEMNDVLSRIVKSLKPNGIFYASFKYGNKEFEKDGRYFNFYDEISIKKLIDNHSSLSPINFWISNDLRPNRGDDLWINILLKKLDLKSKT